MMINRTIICRSLQSFIDICENNLVADFHVHCTFELFPDEFSWMECELKKNGGGELTTAK